MYDSSGFEHVFVGETRGDSEVIGFHNWIQFYLQERAGYVDYQGYILGTKVSVLKVKCTYDTMYIHNVLPLARRWAQVSFTNYQIQMEGTGNFIP